MDLTDKPHFSYSRHHCEMAIQFDSWERYGGDIPMLTTLSHKLRVRPQSPPILFLEKRLRIDHTCGNPFVKQTAGLRSLAVKFRPWKPLISNQWGVEKVSPVKATHLPVGQVVSKGEALASETLGSGTARLNTRWRLEWNRMRHCVEQTGKLPLSPAQQGGEQVCGWVCVTG